MLCLHMCKEILYLFLIPQTRLQIPDIQASLHDAREAGSAEIELGTLEDVLTSFQGLDEAGIEPELYGGLGDAVRQLVRWLRMINASGRLQNTEGQHHEVVLAGREVMTSPLYVHEEATVVQSMLS